MINVKIKWLTHNLELPAYQTMDSAGMDLRAAITQKIILKPMERKLIGSGFCIAIPEGYEIQVRARSGLALKNGITMANGVGTIDADYRGEIGVILINLGSDNFVINPGDRIAQMVVSKYERANWQVVEDLDNTDRGSGGFGHTGR